MARWNPKLRRRQSQVIRDWKPWECSTGPRTTQGKKISSQNARKHDHNEFDNFEDIGMSRQEIEELVLRLNKALEEDEEFGR